MSGKRVRREIRDLSPRDWNAVVAAMWIMKNTGDSDGKKKYGAFFVSYDTMVAKHMSAALDPAGDQAHFGAIFPIFHRAWLLELENSLRAIDSKIEALPYWDLNRDLSPLRGQYKSIFSNDYMGSLIGQAPDYAIMDGKFAKWKISTNSKRALQNAFGYLRHPLSPNKCPYVTRNGGTICGTQFGLGDSSMWNTCFQVGDNIMSWSSCVDSRIHGPAHTFIAGSWRRDGQQVDSRNCAQWFGFIGAPSTSKVPVGTNFKTITMNEHYRFGSFISPVGLGCFSCPRCDKSRNPNDCMCKPQPFCGPLWTKLRVATSLRPDSRFIDTSSMSELAPASGIQILGDLGDPSGSANDPLFWAHHGNIDRHFETWMNLYASPTARTKYFNFPTKGFSRGCNLRDVISSTAPFTLLREGRISTSPYTVKEIFDEFTGRKTPYTYDTLLRKQTEQSRTNLRNSWDEPDYQYYNNTEDRKFLRVASIGSSSEVGIQPKNTLRGFYNSSSHFDIAVKATASKDKAQTTYLRTRDLADIIKNWTDIRSLRGTFRLSAQSNPTGNSTTFGTITSSSNYFSDEFVYASVVLLAIFFAAFIGFLLKTMMKNALGSDEEEELKIAVTTEMRQLRYDPNTSDSHDVDQPRVGIRFRARTPTSAPKRSSTSTNTFLLISPNSVIEDSIQTKDTTDKH